MMNDADASHLLRTCTNFGWSRWCFPVSVIFLFEISCLSPNEFLSKPEDSCVKVSKVRELKPEDFSSSYLMEPCHISNLIFCMFKVIFVKHYFSFKPIFQTFPPIFHLIEFVCWNDTRKYADQKVCWENFNIREFSWNCWLAYFICHSSVWMRSEQVFNTKTIASNVK